MSANRMQRRTMEEANYINGAEGEVYATIDGRRLCFLHVTDIEVDLDIKVKEIRSLGKTMAGHKVSGVVGKGKMKAAYVNSAFQKTVMGYIGTGLWPDIEIQVINDDPQSKAGRQTVIIKGVIFGSVPFSKLSAGTEALEEDLDFTFDAIEVPESFKNLPGME